MTRRSCRGPVRLAALLALLALPSCRDDALRAPADVAPFGLDARPRPTTCRPPIAEPYPIRVVPVMEPLSFEEPTTLLQAHDPAQWLILERKGLLLRTARTAEGWTKNVALDLRAKTTIDHAESGLLGFTYSPDFATTGEAFVFYTTPHEAGYAIALSRFLSRDGGLTFDPTSEEIVLSIPKVAWGHNGGRIAFGPDRMLYVTVGDGFWGDPFRYAQDPNQLLGKILRLDVLGPRPYAVPNDNPFVNGAGRGEIYALGFRNPFSLSFDPEGKMWVGDVGHERWEEIDIVTKGGNYGWSDREGTHCVGGDTCEVPNAIDPVFEYSHAEGYAVTGGHVYRGDLLPWLRGQYVLSDFVGGRIWSLEPGLDGRYVGKERLSSGLLVVSIAEGADRELYVIDYFKGGVHRIEAAEPGPVEVPASLRSLGCLDANVPSAMDEGLIPYDVTSPLWSDGLEKHRWLSVPENTTIHVEDDGRWNLPNGAITLKTFVHEGKRVETRMFTRDGDRWLGYAFQWNDAQDDAVLLTEGKTVQLGDLTWEIPSRAQCLACHTAAVNRTIGLETAQMNRPFVYPTTNRSANQLATLGHVGLFDTLIDPATSRRLVDPSSDEGTLEERARSYLHGNCAQCHRPLGPGQGLFDLRATTPREEAHLVCALSSWGSTADASAIVLAPGKPDLSVLLTRMELRGTGQMPPLGSSRVDPLGSLLVRSWVTSLSACDDGLGF